MPYDARPFRAAAVCLAVVGGLVASPAHAAPPAMGSAFVSIRLDGVRLGTATANRSSYPTLLHDTASQRYHMWVAVVDETPPGTAPANFHPLRIAGYRHATSGDGASFVTAGALSMAGAPFATPIYGTTYGEPPWFYPKAVLWSGRYTLLTWTINYFFGGGVPTPFGDYNYNLSANDIGVSPDNHVLLHLGPVGSVPGNGIYGQTAGAFGLVNGIVYYDNNSQLGRSALTDSGPVTPPLTADTGPWRLGGVNSAVADPLPLLGYIACHLAGGNTYMHNDARVLDNGDGTLGFFFSLRNCDGSRKAAQIWYMESADNGQSWSAPVGIFTGPVTIDGAAPSGGFALADVVIVNGTRVVYFSAPDAAGNLVVAASPPPALVQSEVPIGGLATWVMACLVAALGLGSLRRERRHGAGC